MADSENNYKVRLIPIASLTYGGDPSSIRESQVAFDVTPSFSETRTAEYTPVTPVHMPGAMQVYKHTNSRQFEITAHFISRNVQDAIKNMGYLQKLRGWLMPYFGATDTITDTQRQARANASYTQTNQNLQPQTEAERDAGTRRRIQSEGVQLRGAPPDVLYLYAYSSGANDLRGIGPRVNINRVPVVMTNLGITYPEDVDYIPVYDPEGSPSQTTEPFPRKMDVTISLVETHSPREYEKFDLMAYKLGNLVNF
jgi:hypothetical protein